MSPHDFRAAVVQARLARMRELLLLDEGLAAALKPSVGLRNVVVHEYLDVDHAVVAAALPLARRDYGRYVRSVADWLAAR